MSGLLNVIGRLATWRGMAVLLVLYATVFGLIIVTVNQLSDMTSGYSILDFEPGYDKARVMEVLGSYGPKGVALNARV